MPTLTYPGVYVEELSSGVHTITGVATSIAAFIGWAPQGPTDEAMLVESWAQYQALYGGWDSRSVLGYAVNQFFGNGGQQAYIVRLVWDGSLNPAAGTSPVPAATAVAAGVGYGTASITAMLGSLTSPPIAVSVGPSVLQGLGVVPLKVPAVTAGGPFMLPAIPFGATVPFSALGSYSDGTNALVAGVAWKTSNTAVITITPAGVATAVGAGTATLTASITTPAGVPVSGSLDVRVDARTLTGIALTPSAAFSLAAGWPPVAGKPQQGPTRQLTATGTFNDGSTIDLSGVVNWTSSQTTTATVSGTGLVTAGNTQGAATITAAWAGQSATVTVNVTAAAVTSLAVHPAAPVLTAGDNPTFVATALLSDNSQAPAAGAAWTSSNTAVATVVTATGAVTAVAPGTTTISVTSNGQTASVTLKVTSATLNALSIGPANPSVPAGNTLPLTATGFYSDGTTADLTSSASWKSATPAAAAVDQNTGVVSGVSVAPSTAITATWLGQAPSVNVVVTAPVPASLQITPNGANLLSGGSLQLKATLTNSDQSRQDVTGTAKWQSSQPGVVSVGTSTGLATAVAAGGTLSLFAKNPGQWDNTLFVSVTPKPSDPTRFGLLVQQQLVPGGSLRTLESFVDLSVKPADPSYVVDVVDKTSDYISFIPPGANQPIVPAATPSATSAPIPLTGGADGTALVPATDGNFEVALKTSATAGYQLLDHVFFNLLCVPGETDASTITTLQQYCASMRAFYIVDSPKLTTIAALQQNGPLASPAGSITGGTVAANSAYYFPWIEAPDPLAGNRTNLYPPCGAVAGQYAATDASRGVWKAPAGLQAAISGISGLQYPMTDLENGDLNIQAINCLREFKVFGDVVWGARTLSGNDQAGSEWKYVPVRRLALFIESSLYDGTQWVVFEPNDEPLWGQIRLNVGAFMQGLFLKGAFQGASPSQAYFVKCDGENNPQASINLGVVNILVGFAPLKPAEFVVIQIQQMVGELA